MKALKLYWIDMKERHLEENEKEILLLVQESNRKQRRNSMINGCYYLKKHCIFTKKIGKKVKKTPCSIGKPVL